MVIFGHGDGANLFVPAAVLVSYSTNADVPMDDMNPNGPFYYTVPEVV